MRVFGEVYLLSTARFDPRGYRQTLGASFLSFLPSRRQRLKLCNSNATALVQIRGYGLVIARFGVPVKDTG